MNFKRWIYYRFTRFSVRNKWSKNKIPDLSKVQEHILKITLALISDNDSELLINPTIDSNVGEKYYIKKLGEDEEIEKFVTISKTSTGCSVALMGHEIIEGSKHNYHYEVWLSESCGNVIADKFSRVIRRRRNKMESEIRKGDERTLELIIKKLEKK